MISGVSRGLQFRHIIMFTEGEGIFASAVEEATKKTRIFLIIGSVERAYQRDSRTNSWRLLDHDNFSFILQSICSAVNAGMMILKINASLNSVINIDY